MQHEILYLNESRVYVRVDDTWYDTNKNLEPKVGAPFLLGRIAEVLSYDEYHNLYPGATKEIYQDINETVDREGYIRATLLKKLSRTSWIKTVNYGVIKRPKKDVNGSTQSEE